MNGALKAIRLACQRRECKCAKGIAKACGGAGFQTVAITDYARAVKASARTFRYGLGGAGAARAPPSLAASPASWAPSTPSTAGAICAVFIRI